MYRDEIVAILGEYGKPMAINEVRKELSARLSLPLNKVCYGTVKKDLKDLAAVGKIHAKIVGGGKRSSWIFWAPLRVKEEKKTEAVPKKDPFDVSIEKRDSLSLNQVVALYDDVFERYGTMIKSSLEQSHARFLVLCSRRVILTSNDPDGPSTEEIRALERKRGKVCYVITKDLIEESAWSLLGHGDYYPTIEIFIGNSDWEDEDVFSRGLRVVADFDTGNPEIAAFNAHELTFLKPGEPFEVRRAIHLGGFYDFYLRRAKIGIRDVSDDERCLSKGCRCVLSWERVDRNPFLLANSNRAGFVGRDLMIKFPFNVSLLPLIKGTRIQLV